MNFANFKIQLGKITAFSKDECTMFIPHLNRMAIKKGEFFLYENQLVNEIEFVEPGVLRLYHLSNEKEINRR